MSKKNNNYINLIVTSVAMVLLMLVILIPYAKSIDILNNRIISNRSDIYVLGILTILPMILYIILALKNIGKIKKYKIINIILGSIIVYSYFMFSIVIVVRTSSSINWNIYNANIFNRYSSFGSNWYNKGDKQIFIGLFMSFFVYQNI